mmetsp:Transcript_10313/g.30757  ORF Transcript_10313/g.30757 Transcript_10313/m.30757 type:complete len:210 (+) Transcript_10313:98-727(+)
MGRAQLSLYRRYRWRLGRGCLVPRLRCMLRRRPFVRLLRRAIEPHLEPVGVVTVEVVLVQPLVAHKAEPVVQPQGANVGRLCLEDSLVATALPHGEDGGADEARAHASLAHRVVHRQHRDVAARPPAAVHVLLAHNDADDLLAARRLARGSALGGAGRERHKAELRPLVDKVAVRKDGVGLGEVDRDEVDDALQLVLALVRHQFHGRHR